MVLPPPCSLSNYRRLLFPSVLRSRLCLSLVSFLIGYLFHSFISVSNRSSKGTLLTENNLLMNLNSYSEEDEDLLLVIIIFSSVNNFNKRQAIRDTWLSDVSEGKHLKHYFVISQGTAGEDQKVLLSVEEEKHGDLLILSNLEDSFHSLTPKLVASLGWLMDTEVLQGQQALAATKKTFKSFKFVLKCDDDSFVRVNEVVNELRSVYSGAKGENLYWGFFDGRAKVKKAGKYKEEEWKICDTYAPYALGGGYVLARPLVAFIVSNEKHLKKYRNEDVSVGAWLSSYEGINRVHDPRFDTEYLSRGCHQTYLITHKHSETAMQTFHENLRKTGHLCQKEFKTRISYVYNWKVAPSNCCSRINPAIP